MKIIQVNTVYGTGSTGKIAASLYKLAIDNGFEARVAYGRGKTPMQNNIDGFLIGNKPDFYHHVLVNFFLGKSGFASKKVTAKFLKWLDNEKPNLLHLHNLHGFYIHVGMLFEYIKKHDIPVVWTLHDCWAFTGQCAHFDYIGCDKWKIGCHNCPIYRIDYPYSLFKDNSKENYILKKEAFTGVKNLTIVTPSHWLAGLVRQSFLKEYPIKVIPNGIDLDIFSPYENKSENDSINDLSSICLNANKNIPFHLSATNNLKILLGVANVWDKRKGLEYMLKLSKDFNPENGYQIVLIGLSKRQCNAINRKYGNKIITITRTNNQFELAEWYRKAFVYINPTLQETLSLTNIEALACGTPVITFNSGGTPETLSFDNDPQGKLLSKCGIIISRGNYPSLKKAIYNFPKSAFAVSSCISQANKFNRNEQFAKYIILYKSVMF